MIKTLSSSLFSFYNAKKFKAGLGFAAKVFFVITALVRWVPFTPIMLTPNLPPRKLDPSWMFAINQAASQNLVFGKEIIFTNGPYAAVYTQMYHPATDAIMMWGALLVSMSYILLALLLARQENPLWLFVLGSFIAATPTLDPLFRSYPFLFALVMYKVFFQSSTTQKVAVKSFDWAVLFLSLFAMGMLPLIKGTFLISVGIYIFLAVSMLISTDRNWKAVLVIILIPGFSLIAFWMLAAQPISALKEYFLTMVPIISGYTVAMSLPGAWKDIALFVLASVLMIAASITEKPIQFKSQFFLSIAIMAHLFLGFKAGFVRYDVGHARLAINTLYITGLLLTLLSFNRTRKVMLLLTVALAWVILTPNLSSLPQIIHTSYQNAWNGLWTRIVSPEQLAKKYAQSLSIIQDEVKVPALPGTVDIYSYRQVFLLTSDNIWSPRPVFQSYAAYTPELIQINAAHLMGNKAPDYLLFRVETIDGRLFSLEDGMSWPIIISRYSVRSLIGDSYILLQKRNEAAGDVLSEKAVIYSATHKFGDVVEISNQPNPLLAEIMIEPTFLGKLSSLVYKPPEIRINLTLENGENRDYRLIPSMTKTPFFISPLVETNDDFVLLATNDANLTSMSKVKNIQINDSKHPSKIAQKWFEWAWQQTYHITLSTVPLRQDNTLADLGFLSKAENADLPNPVSPHPVYCEGFLDTINKQRVQPGSFVSITNLLSIVGWTAISTTEGTAPEIVYIVLTDKTGKAIYIQSQKDNRPDVATHFDKPGLSNTGYRAIFDVTSLEGIYTLGIARVSQGVLEHCNNFANTIEINPTPLP